MKRDEFGVIKSEKIRSVRNLFLTYLFISVISGRPEIFAAICASFPIILPLIFLPDKKTEQLLTMSFICGIPGILLGVLYLIFFGTYSTVAWIVPATFSFFMCLLYKFMHKHMKLRRLITARAVIIVAVCFIALI